ncbi:MAG: hypothetical protein IIA41_02810, partial [SAR324 cluster bacterium]|nr:hypothetical protein [SAR324 cluster bacterium]
MIGGVARQFLHALREHDEILVLDLTGTVSIGGRGGFFSGPGMLVQLKDRMNAAEKRLGHDDAVAARESQDQAIARLTEAVELLNALDRRVAKEEMRRTLGEIRHALESMAQAERHIDDDVRALHKMIQAKGRVSRTEAREAARLARDQHA